MLQTDLQPLARFKASWPVLKPANGSRGVGGPISLSWNAHVHYFYVMPYVLNYVHRICWDETFNAFLSECFPSRLPEPREVLLE